MLLQKLNNIFIGGVFMERTKTYHKWTKAEKEKLLEFRNIYVKVGLSLDCQAIAAKMNECFHTDSFTAINCNLCFSNLKHVDKRREYGVQYYAKQKFSPEEDEKLKALVLQYGTMNWEQIAANMSGRNARQCKDRYVNYLRSDIKHGVPFTSDEDTLLLDKVNELGPKWNIIAQYFNGRSANQIKNRYYTYLKKRPTKKDKLILSEETVNETTLKSIIDDAKEKAKSQIVKPPAIPELLNR